MPLLKLERSKEFYGQLAKYNILIDDVSVGKICNGETLDLLIDKGSHTLKIQLSSNSSNVLPFDIDEHETRSFRISISKAGHFINSLPIMIIGFTIAYKSFFGIGMGMLIAYCFIAMIWFIYANDHKGNYFHLEALDAELSPVKSSAETTASQNL